MSNIMSNFKLMNKPSRNGFDLTTRNSFTAKVGELLPVLCEECLPGDKFKINLSHFSRTQPLTSPAYIRIKEYYDFVFVPTRLLWKYFDSFVTQMPNNIASASSVTEVNKLARHPYFTRNAISECLAALSSASIKDDMGFDVNESSLKLLEYLNYGNIRTPGTSPTIQNNALNPFPLLAYQKAYCDLYRFDQWENPEPHTFNLDYMYQSGSMEIPLGPIEDDLPAHCFFSLRYANYPKDLFMGVLPNSQYGDVSIVSTTSGLNNLVSWDTGTTPSHVRLLGANGVPDSTSADDFGTYLQSKANIDKFFNFSILALRQAEFLQKYKEVSQTAKQDYRDQIKAHWGVDVSKARANICEYLGGTSANVQISGETNTNLSDGTTLIKGTALSATRGMIDYDIKEHGYLLCIYHASPLLDYLGNTLVHPMNFKTMPTDYAIPEMDKTGMQLMPSQWLYGNYTPLQDGFRGYVPRYIDYKTDVDRTHGAFNSTYNYWVAPFSLARLSGSTTYKDFKIDSSIYNQVFGVDVDESVDTDQIFCNASFDVKAVRNLDVNGMPY